MIKKFSNKLPTILQTDTQKEFFSATFDQLFSPSEVEQAQGFIGRRSSDVFFPREDNYIREPSKLRAAYQLEPIAYAVNTALEDTNEMFYEDLLNYIKFRGGDISNHDRLFADDFYSFAPPIDIDKYLNYQNYLWLEDGGPTIFVQYVGSGGAPEFDNIIENQIIGQTQFNTSENKDLRPRGLDLSSGMRIRFEGSSSFDRPLWIEGVGREIRLVENLTTLQPGSSVINVLWDNSIIAEAAAGTGYTITMVSVDGLVNPGRDYVAGDILGVVHTHLNGETTRATISVDTITTGTELSTIVSQDETDFDGAGSNGTFTAGSSYDVGDVIFLDDGTEVTVDSIDGSGAILTFDITKASTTSFTTASTLTQDSTSRDATAGPANPAGAGFSLTTDTNNETPINAVATFSLDSAGDYLFAPPVGPIETETAIILNSEDETNYNSAANNGSFIGGTGYAATDTITLDDGAIITVDTVSTGVVTEFTITTAPTNSRPSGTTRTQSSTSGGGSSFTLTPGTSNEAAQGSESTFDVTIQGGLITVSGGTFTVAATLRATEVSAIGAVEKVEIVNRGTYTVFPSNPAATTGGTGSDLQVDLFENGDTGELWDNSIITAGFDSSEFTDLSNPDYLTIERGSCEGSPWTRTNRWFNIDIINTAQTLGQIIDTTIISGGINYSVGDQLPVDGDGINGVVTVTAVDGAGSIIGIRISSRGQGYSFGSIDQTGATGTTDTVLWDATDATPTPSGESWDVSFEWDEVITSGGGQDAIINITLASAIDRSTKGQRPILEFRRDLQLREFGNRFLFEIQVVADTELFADVEGQAPGVIVDGIELKDGMHMIFLDPSQVPNFFQWDEDPAGPNTPWDVVPWEAEGASGAVSRFIWEVQISGGSISLLKVDPETGIADANAGPVPVGGTVLATLGNNYAGDSFYQFRDPISGTFTWRPGQIREEENTEPLYELYDINGVQLDDELEYPESDFTGNEIFSYRILTAADLGEDGGSLTNDAVLGFPLTLKGLRQISDIVFENDLETNRVTFEDGEIPGYYFYKEWDAAPDCTIREDATTGEQLSTFKTNWLASDNSERQRVIDRFLTEEDTDDSFTLSATPRIDESQFDIRVNEGRRLNSDEFAFIESTGQIKIFEKPTDTGFEIADGTDSLYSFVGITDPAEVYINELYEERGLDYNVLQSVQLDSAEVATGLGGSGYVVNDVLTAVGGTTENPAQVRVVSVDGGGAITGIFISNRGVYAVPPSSPFAVIGGTGSGAFLQGTFIDATDNSFTIQFIDANGTPRIIPAGNFIEVREQGSGAPGADSIVEVIYSTFDPITDEDVGFFEIPNGLENNPNNLEIEEQSWSEFSRHMTSIIQNQDIYLGTAFGGINNYRDTEKDGSEGEFILQSQAPLLKTMLAASSNDLDIIEALRFNSKEYSRYKNKFTLEAKKLINQGFTPFNDGDSIPIDQWVDEAIRRIIRSREYANAFEDTYMLAYGTVFEEETFNFVSTVTSGITTRNFNTLVNFIDLSDKKNTMYVYVDETIQRLDVDYIISNDNPIEIEWINVPTGTFTITVRLYENMAPAHIPATPQKLGLAPIFRPRVMRDESYQAPIDVLLNHDGSKTPLFGDFRDDLLFEFETRIYNGILEQFRVDYDIPLNEDTYKPGKYRTTRWDRVEWDRLLRPSFFKWVAASRADYITNEFYDPNNEWTWNYSSVIDADDDTLPGYWRGIFDFYYDTQTPAVTPWEMLGFTYEPAWWEQQYGAAPWPNTSPMWQDLEDGRIRQGFREGIDSRYARPGLTDNSIPVDVDGILLSTPLLAIANDGSLLGPNSVDASKAWAYGDLAPVEYAWRIGEEFSFAVSEAIFLARPGEYGEKFWDPEHTFFIPVRTQQVVSNENSVFKRVGNDTLSVHGETVGGVKQVNTGWQVWVSGRLRALGKNLGNDFGQKVRTLNVKLGHKMASFTNKDTMKVFVEGISVASQANNLLIPQENINVSLHTSPPVKEYIYGGVLIRAQADGSYQLFGYDILNGEFPYFPRKTSPNDSNINVGGQPESFTVWQSGTTYSVNDIVRFNSIFYRAIVAHSNNSFDVSQWQKLSQLPTVGGINVTFKPKGEDIVTFFQYGEELATEQEVFDLIIGYGQWLESEGWVFDNKNPESGQVETWLSAAKQFLLWTQTNWEANSIVMISPSATGATLNVQEGYPSAVEKITNGVYSILDKQGVVIDPRNTIVKRDGRNISILPAIEQVGIYGARINSTETESILTFDNVTNFNDTIYDPLLGSRLARVNFNGRRTTNWSGKLEAGGYIITEDRLIPNFENLVNSIRFYHDTETTLDNPNVENAARHNIGFSEREYYDELEIQNDSQFQFYQGAIRQKGTVQSIRRLERSTKVGDATEDTQVFEEWALRIGDFAGVCSNQTVEFLIRANEVKVDPQLVELQYPRSNTSGAPNFFTNDDITGNNITITNHNFTQGDLKLYTIPVNETGSITGLTNNTIYSVIVVDSNTISLAEVSNPNVAIAIIGNGIGTDKYRLNTPINGSVSSILTVSRLNTYTTVPTVTLTNHPDDTQGTGAIAIAILDSDSTLLRIDVLNPGFGYILPPTVHIGDIVIEESDDRAVAQLQFEITEDIVGDDSILIDIDDNLRWPTQPTGISCAPIDDLWPTTVERVAYTLPNAGNVSILDTNFRYVSTAGLDTLSTLASPPSEKGETIHVAYGENEDWAVYLLNNLRLTKPELVILEQLPQENPVYTQGRVILGTNLSGIAEDLPLETATLSFSTNGSGNISNITITNSGYGYWEESSITITSASDSGFTPGSLATVPITNINGELALNIDQQTITSQNEANFSGIGEEGTFTGGTSYAALDTITLSDGSVVEVNNVSSGVITQFTITTNSVTPFTTIGTLTQSSTSGLGSGFTLTLGGANAELVTPIGSGYSLSLTNQAVSNQDIPGATQSGRFLRNVAEAGRGVLYVDNILYDYEYSGAQTATGVIPIGRGTGYAIGDELSVNGGFTDTSPAIINVDSIRTIAGQTQGDFSGVSPNGSFVAGTGYSDARNTFDSSSDVSVSANEISITDHGYTTGDAVVLREGTTVPGGLSDNTVYYIIRIDANTVQFALNATNATSGIVIELSSTGVGIHSLSDTIFLDDATIITVDEIGQTPLAAQDETDYDGAGNNGTFTAGRNYAAADTITLEDGSIITVDAISGNEQIIVGQTEDNYSGSGGEGTFTAGINYSTGDVITMSDGSTVEVGPQNDGAQLDDGPVQRFTIITPSTSSFSGGATLTQSSSTGGGTGFELNTNVGINSEEFGDIATFTITTEGTGNVPGGTAIQQSETSNNGAGFTLTLGTNNYGTSDGIVTQFTIDTAGNNLEASGTTQRQAQTTAIGVGFELILDSNNEEILNISLVTGGDYTVLPGIITSNHTSLAFDASANTITRTGGSDFITLGFGTGQRIIISNAEDVPNNGTYTIIDATTNVITLLEDIPTTNTADTSATLETETASVVTVNGGLGTGATFTLEEFRGLYDIIKDNTAVEDDTFLDNTEFFILSNIRYANTTNRDNFVDADIAAGIKTVWIDDNGSGVWEVQNVTVPIVAAQTEEDYTNGWTENRGDHGSFAGGTNHTISDIITLSNGATVTVDAISEDGVVIEFTITTAGSNVQHSDTLEQINTTGSGIAFKLTVDSHNLNSELITYTQREVQDILIDTNKFKNAFVYEQDTGDTVIQLPVYDPFKGLIPGIADLNIMWTTRNDPARYNNAADERLLSDTRLFDGDQVGLIWWDLSTCAYLYYEQGTNQYRRDNWGKLIEGSNIDIYEWTRSPLPPEQYNGDGTVRSTTEFVLKREYDRNLEEVRTFYYFWVKDRTIVPEGVERTIAAFEVARLLSNPTSQLFQWFSPISQDAFMFSGIEGSFTDSNNIVQINYRRTENEEPKHVEWQLGREGDPDYDILPKHWNKMVDSLTGFTDLVAIGNLDSSDGISTFQTDTTGVNNATEVITTDNNHNYTTGRGVFYSNELGSEDIGLIDGVMYYVNVIDSNQLSLHATRTDAVADSNRIDITSSGSETHSLTGLVLDLNNFRNAIPSAADNTKGYLVVPDPTLSSTERLGIRTRPLQTMYNDMFAARRIFVDKVNELMKPINLRDENPTWNSSLTTNNLWDWVDWFLEGFDETNTIPTFQVNSINDMDDIEQIIDGDIVRVAGTRQRLFVYHADTDSFILVGREASRLQLSSDIYTKELNLPDAIELRELITALDQNVFTVDRAVFSNLIFFALLNYVFSEQEDLDWAFKTTYIFLKQQGRTLQQDRVFQNDPFDAALDFITEFKPYQTKIRDFRIERSAEIDLVPGTAEELVRDFTVDMRYDRIRGGDLSVAEMRIAKFEGQEDSRWDGYTTRDGDSILVRLGAAGRFVRSQTDLIGNIADVNSDFFEAYTTNPIEATITFDTTAIGTIDAGSLAIIDGGQGYYEGGTFVITDASLTGNDNAVVLYTVDTVNGKGVIDTVALIQAGSGYTLNQIGVSVASGDLPTLTSAAITNDELEAIATINERITNVFAFDFEGLFLQNTEFTGNPSLISAEISDDGTGYTTGDILSLDAGSGIPITNAQFRVAATSGGGDITELQLINGGSYQQTPTVDPVNLLGGTGTGASVTNLLFETGSGVPFDSTPHDQIGWDSSAFDPSIDSLEGTPLNLYRTIAGQTHNDFNSGTNEGSFVGGSGYVVAEIITLEDGTDITVDVVDGGGAVVQFTITGGSTTSNMSEVTLTQTSTTGIGTGFEITLGLGNQSSANFFDVPAEETFNGTGTQREFILTTTVPTVFLFVVVDGIEQRLNVDYFFIADELIFITAPQIGVNNIQIFTYIEAGDLINPQVREGAVEEMVPLDPRENLVLRCDTVDVTLNNGGTGYTGGEVLTVQGGTLKAGGAAMTITVDSVSGDAVNTFTITMQGDYDIYPSSPVSVLGTGGNDDATFDITFVSFTIHEDTQQGITYYRNNNSASTRLTTNVNPSDTVIAIDNSVPLDPQPDWDNPVLAWIGTELVQYHEVQSTYTVDSIIINNAGTGYSVGDILTIEGNTIGPVSNAIITVDTIGGGGDITGATLTINGSYKENPGTVDVSVTAGSITGQDETDFNNIGDNGTFTGGSGYSSSDNITMDDGTVITVNAVDAEAQIDFTTDTTGVVDSVTLINGGSGYISGGNFNITSASDGGFVGTPAIITYTVSGGVIDSVIITNAGSGYTASLNTAIASADIPDPTLGGVTEFTITGVTTIASETDPGADTITLNQSSVTPLGGGGFTLVLDVDNQSGDENATFDLTVSTSASAIAGVRRGYRGTHPQSHSNNNKIFSGQDNQLLPNPEIFWTDSVTTADYSGTAGQWRFIGIGSSGFASIHFSDTTDNAFNANVTVGETLVVTDTNVGFKYLITDIINTGELGIVTITAPGTGYQIGDIIDIDSVATGGTGVTAEVGAVDNIGGIVYVRITNRGSGYTDVGAVAITNSEITSANGSGATMNVFFDEEGLVGSLPNRILDVNGIIAEVDGLTWQIDSLTYGLADPDVGNTNVVSVFLRNGQGNAI